MSATPLILNIINLWHYDIDGYLYAVIQGLHGYFYLQTAMESLIKYIKVICSDVQIHINILKYQYGCAILQYDMAVIHIDMLHNCVLSHPKLVFSRLSMH